ncbi:MAG: GatB/YqeY domain-containing protein [Patescibacteria group bacterium]
MIREKIEQNLKLAQKSQDEATVSTLRLVLASMKNFQIEQRGRDLTDDDMIMLLKREAKKRTEAIEAYTKGGREELRAKEAHELQIIREYLPPEMSEEEVSKVIQAVIGDLGVTDPSQFGRVMSESMKRLGNQASGQIVSAVVKKALTKPKD